MKKWLKKIPSFYRNKFVITSLIFFLWMAFFDNNDLIRQYKVWDKLQEVKAEKKRKQEMIQQTKQSLAQLKDKSLLEKFAREKYMFKRDNEDIFVVVAEE
ncbi:MAG: FtsB family cell division protein [Bacteroidota bacterium]